MLWTRLSMTGFCVALIAVPITPVLSQGIETPKVLTVCEALREIHLYRGRVVVIVGHSSNTFEGSFLHEECNPDGHILIQGHAWLSAIALGDAGAANQIAEEFPVDERILREKLSQLMEYRNQLRDIESRGAVSKEKVRTLLGEAWVAVYGTLESPAKLRPHRPANSSSSRNVAGNGYGANGSVPAMILTIRSKAVPP